MGRRLILGLAAAAAVAGAGYYWWAAPESFAETLVCRRGAYDLEDGRIVVISQSSEEALRFTLMDGDSGRLYPTDADNTRFAAGPGLSSQPPPVRAEAAFGACDDPGITLTLEGATVAGAKRRLESIETRFDSHGLMLRGRLTLPPGEEPVATAIWVHGSEDYSAVDYDRFQYMLPTHGIAVFVYDKRGTGRSEGTYSQDFHLLSDDAAAAAREAQRLLANRAGPIGFLGGSQGGWIGPLAATKFPAAFVVAAYGFAESPLAEDRHEVMLGLRERGHGDDVLAKAREITDATGRIMATGGSGGWEELDALKEKYGAEPWLADVEGEYTGDFVRNPSWGVRLALPFFDTGTSWNYDPVPTLRSLDIPQLWILAGRDREAPSAETRAILRSLQAEKPALDLVVFEEADHGILLFEEQGGARTYTRYAPGYFPLLAGWISERALIAAGPDVTVHPGTASISR